MQHSRTRDEYIEDSYALGAMPFVGYAPDYPIAEAFVRQVAGEFNDGDFYLLAPDGVRSFVVAIATGLEIHFWASPASYIDNTTGELYTERAMATFWLSASHVDTARLNWGTGTFEGWARPQICEEFFSRWEMPAEYR